MKITARLYTICDWLHTCVHTHKYILYICSGCLSVEPRDELYAKTGSTVTLTCSVGGLENGSVTWMKGDIGSSVRVDSLNDSRISTESNSLTITNYHNSEHGGSYYCAAQGPDNHHQHSCPTHVQHASESM